MLNKDLVKICSRLNQLKPSACTLQARRAVWVKTVEERSKNASYELSQVLKVCLQHLGLEKCVMLLVYSLISVKMVFNGFIISFMKYYPLEL